MNPTVLAAIAILTVAFVNLVDWLVMKTGRLLYFPTGGWFRSLMIAILAGTFICAVLLLAGTISGAAFFAVVLVQAATHEGYSIWRRHRAAVRA